MTSFTTRSMIVILACIAVAVAGCSRREVLAPLPSADSPGPASAVSASPEPPPATPSITPSAETSPAAAPASPAAVPTSCGPFTPLDRAPDGIPAFARDRIATVIVDDLRVRSAPQIAECSEKLEPLLDAGRQLFVTDGPVAESGYHWYRVEPIGSNSSSPSGWVASASRDGVPWVEPAQAPVCSNDPPTPSSLARMSTGARLACLGSAVVRFEASIVDFPGDIDYGGSGVVGYPADLSPDPTLLLVDPGVSGIDLDRGWFTLYLAQGADAPDPLPKNTRVNIVGHFDDPASRQCRYAAEDADNPPEDPVVLCRSQFLVTSVMPD